MSVVQRRHPVLAQAFDQGDHAGVDDADAKVPVLLLKLPAAPQVRRDRGGDAVDAVSSAAQGW